MTQEYITFYARINMHLFYHMDTDAALQRCSAAYLLEYFAIQGHNTMDVQLLDDLT